MSAKDIMDMAKKGNPDALSLLEEFGKILGRGMAIISCIADPEVFIIGGGVSAAGEILLAPVRKYFRQYAFHASRDAKIKLADLLNDAGIYGGAYTVLDTLETK